VSIGSQRAFSLMVQFMPASGAHGTGCRRIAEPGDRPVTALRRKTGRLVKNAYGSCARVCGGERSALCLMVCAHGRRQRREVARMDMRSYNEQVKRAFAPTRPGGRVPVTGPTRYPRST
jgi:hypothetical protein